MAFSFAAFTYIIALIFTAFLIFFAIWYVISIDELKTDYKNPIETCNNLNPLVLPEYFVHAVPSVLFIFAGEWGSFFVCGLQLLAKNRKKSLGSKKILDQNILMSKISDLKSTF